MTLTALILAAAREVYPLNGARGVWRRARFIGRAWKARGQIKTWLDLGDAGGLATSLAERPKMIGVIEWPYLHKHWDVPRRFEVVRGHYAEIADLKWLRIGVHESRTLCELGDLLPELRIVLDRPEWFLREGELCINLFIEDTRVYSLAFTLGREQGKRITYVGAMQGRNLDNIEAIYKQLTKKLHGARPRDFLFTVFQVLCVAAGVERVLGVNEECRHHKHPYFGAKSEKTVSASYDDIWKDRDGLPADGGFFELPAAPSARPDNDIPSHKRSMYRKRYALFDRVRDDVAKFAGSAESVFAAGYAD